MTNKTLYAKLFILSEENMYNLEEKQTHSLAQVLSSLGATKDEFYFHEIEVQASLYNLDNLRVLLALEKNFNQEHLNLALIKSIQEGNLEVAKYVYYLGGQAQIENLKNDEQPIMIAAREQNAEFISWLVKLGADINQKNIEGKTPLMIATMLGNIEMVKAIIACNAKTKLKDWRGQTALDYARIGAEINSDLTKELYEEIIEILESAQKAEELYHELYSDVLPPENE